MIVGRRDGGGAPLGGVSHKGGGAGVPSSYPDGGG